eukprot:CAMPEP_0118924768 /NCGR_PEP_ID=MMETSP1169-20130426/2749_1 /TAXON_ID=36882 /ORGANISM="Pyramimonas obovata, Strain CCMP722" /LENGTH=298 /DNA_ID=CAMNT_0006865899 /DNA_START=207 /DNA_END=1099 /DNA_ORIENTATION=+
MTDIPVDIEPPSYASVHESAPPSYASVHESAPPSYASAQPTAESPQLPPDMVFDIDVSDPVKQGDGVNAHVSYRVSTTTNLPQYRWSEFSVIRRFSDFVWLRQRLAECNRGTIIPPLPEKGVATKVFTISTGFIEARRKALVLFLKQVSQHPTLCFSSDLQFFLEASEEAWAEQKQRATSEAASGAHKKPLAQFSKMFTDAASSLVNGGQKVERFEDAEQLRVQEFYTAGTTHVADVKRQAERLVRKQRDMGKATAECGDALQALSACETGLLKEALIALGTGMHDAAKVTEGGAEAL